MKKPIALKKSLPYVLVIAALIGLICAFILTLDAFDIAKNPHTQLDCNLNPVISCGPVITAKEAEAFNFPNPFLGLAAFAALATIGVVMLAGASLRRWFWLCLQTGATLGLGFIAWLFYESVYRIGALCPYCIVVWVVTITVFWYVLLYNIEQGFIKLPAFMQPANRFGRQHHIAVLVFAFAAITAVILNHFWYYYGKHL